MPLAQTGACLPRQLLHAVGYAALDIPQHRLLLLFGELLAYDDGLHAVAVVAQALVVEVGGDLQAFVADLAEWQCRIVEIDNVGIVFVDDVYRAVVELVEVCLVGL